MAGKTSKPTFFWQGVLILLPVLLMAGFGTWAILREQRAVESDARERAREILQSLPYLFNQGLAFRFDFLAVQSSAQNVIPDSAAMLDGSEKGREDVIVEKWGAAGNIMPGELTNSGNTSFSWWTSQPDEVWPMNFLLDASGSFWDLTWQDAPHPPDWFISLNEEQRAAWFALRESDLNQKPAPEISTRMQNFLNTSPPVPARECAGFISLRAQVESPSGPEALNSLFKFATVCSDAETDTGIPLSNLVMAELLRRAPVGGSNAEIQSQLEFEIRYRPSVLTPALLNEAQRFGAADEAFAKRLKVLRAICRSREVQRELADDIKSMDVRTETGNISNFWIQTPEERWFCILQPEQIVKVSLEANATTNKIISARTNILTEVLPFPETFLAKSFDESLTEARISLPDYFGISIELEGQTIDLPTRWRKSPGAPSAGYDPLLDVVNHVSDSAFGTRKVLALAHNPPDPSTVLAEQEITLSQPGERSHSEGTDSTKVDFLPSHPRLTVRVVLTDRSLLYARQTERQLVFGTLIAFSVVAALIGFAMARRAFTTQLHLNEAKSNFVSSVSHELRAPIASVRLMAESLERGKVNEVQKQNEYFQFIVQECRRLSSLIENVLDFSRIEQGRKQYEFEPTDLAALTRETVKLMEPSAAEKGVTLQTSMTSSEPVVAEEGATPALRGAHSELEVDGRAIQQALVNLIDNAIKHSPKGSAVQVGFECDGFQARLWVEDHGAGIPPEEHEKIFERFYRLGSELRRETQGVGIGLSIVRHIVEAHGGKVTVRSSVGQGSRFTIELPANSNQTADESKSENRR